MTSGADNSGLSEGTAFPVYAVRFSEQAARDLDAAFLWMAENAGVPVAVEWRQGLYREVATLATLPHRCPLAPEKFTREVRNLLYRRSGTGSGSPAYRILFTIRGEEAENEDRLRVIIEHIRHGAARPLTRQQARDLVIEQQ